MNTKDIALVAHIVEFQTTIEGRAFAVIYEACARLTGWTGSAPR